MHPVAEAPDSEAPLDGAARGEGEVAAVDADEAGDDEDDRRTIRGAGSGTGTGDAGEGDELVEGKVIADAHADACDERERGPHQDGNELSKTQAQGRTTTSRGREKAAQVGGGPVVQSPPFVLSS